nr:hypothetical protein [Corynebacterium xerosis]
MTADGDGAGDGAEAAANWVTQSSKLIQNALNLVTDGKFIGLLTIMFGIGLPIDWYLRLSDHASPARPATSPRRWSPSASWRWSPSSTSAAPAAPTPATSPPTRSSAPSAAPCPWSAAWR